MGIENNPSRTRNNSSNSSGKNKEQSKFVHVATGTRHSIGVDSQGVAHSWGKSHSLGQLGRSISLQFPAKTPGPITGLPRKIRNAYASHGSDSDSGHSALLDDAGMLWMTGCDRWQQLGLGSSKGGSTGYTWKGGKLWQEKFVLSRHVTDLMKEQKQKLTSETDGIRDVALGEDHTLVLGSHGTVYAFGKGGDGQLGLVGKPFLSAPIKSTKLSSPLVAAVCAIKTCSATLDSKGTVLNKTGKCNSSMVAKGIVDCRERAKYDGLLWQ